METVREQATQTAVERDPEEELRDALDRHRNGDLQGDMVFAGELAEDEEHDSETEADLTEEAEDTSIEADDSQEPVDPEGQTTPAEGEDTEGDPLAQYRAAIQSVEDGQTRKFIEDELQKHGGNAIAAIASKRELQRKMTQQSQEGGEMLARLAKLEEMVTHQSQETVEPYGQAQTNGAAVTGRQTEQDYFNYYRSAGQTEAQARQSAATAIYWQNIGNDIQEWRQERSRERESEQLRAQYRALAAQPEYSDLNVDEFLDMGRTKRVPEELRDVIETYDSDSLTALVNSPRALMDLWRARKNLSSGAAASKSAEVADLTQASAVAGMSEPKTATRRSPVKKAGSEVSEQRRANMEATYRRLYRQTPMAFEADYRTEDDFVKAMMKAK